MNATVSWLLLAAAICLLPSADGRPAATAAPVPAAEGASAARSARSSLPGRGPRDRRFRSSGALQVIATAAAVATSVAALGPWPGLLAGGVLAPVSIHLVRRLDERKVPARPQRPLALCLDLVAAALRSGQPVPAALALAAPAAGADAAADLAQVARLLRLGAEPAEAWRAVADDGPLAPVAQAACRSADSGIRLARGLEQVAGDMRAEVRAAAQARAQRAGVLAMAPLGLCFLPAFVCLGVLPVVVGVARGAFGVLP
jgi:Flp pilus assembly protein TadB